MVTGAALAKIVAGLAGVLLGFSFGYLLGLEHGKRSRPPRPREASDDTRARLTDALRSAADSTRRR